MVPHIPCHAPSDSCLLLSLCACFNTVTVYVSIFSSLPLKGSFKSYWNTETTSTHIIDTGGLGAVGERSQPRQGSSPRNSFHFEHRPEIIRQTKESIAHQRKQTEFRISTAGHWQHLQSVPELSGTWGAKTKQTRHVQPCDEPGAESDTQKM